ncbi:MAG TPA: molybdenum cofactor guanylyltransferase MobA [Helicobacteraceae bacterium]|nr:molybdenum cofactor guanylyltransferase MobA [Helicobacteraceae bacterium]
MFDLPCVIFAGGKSSRMGTDKSLLPFDNATTLTEFQYHRLKQLFRNVYISTKEAKFNFEAPLILDNSNENIYAPTAGFCSMFSQLKAERFFVISVDAPFIGVAEIQKLLDQDTPLYEATIAKTNAGIQPMCGIYHRVIAPKFTTMLQTNNHKLGKLLKKSQTHFVMFEDEKPFMNINHPDEYHAAMALLNH